MNEIWKGVPDYEGYYEVSNLGRVKSLSREILCPKFSYIKPETVLTPWISSTGYYFVTLSVDAVKKKKRVHHLVTLAFLNHRPRGYDKVVNHINHNKLDNRLENLEIVTQRENANKRHIKSRSKYIGVYWSKAKRKWVASLWWNKKHNFLGLFNTEIEAHEAYQSALISAKRLKEYWVRNK